MFWGSLGITHIYPFYFPVDVLGFVRHQNGRKRAETGRDDLDGLLSQPVANCFKTLFPIENDTICRVAIV
jgi:hypothetical protein